MSAQQQAAASAAELPGGDRPTLPRLLAGIPPGRALGLAEHRALHDELPSIDDRHDGPALIELIEASGLRGRGGGGFPAGAKLRAVAGARKHARSHPVVLVNGAEGEPASFKDRTLLQTLPHLVLDGAEVAARAIGAEEIVLAVCDSAADALAGVRGALDERARQPSRSPLRARLVAVPNSYLAGQESALVNLVGGGPPRPTFTPPLPFERGVGGRPTFVSNVETLAHIALIARRGSDWFRELGLASQPGSALVTLSGIQLAYPGVYEIEVGSPLSALLDAAGGLQDAPRALLFGGYSGGWVDGSLLRGVALSDEHLAPYGAALGAGVIVLLSPETCPVAELTRLTRWLAAQSTRQCGPCLFGLDTIATTVEQVMRGKAPRDTWRRLAGLGAVVRRRGACTHPDGAVRMLSSALEVFADELSDHARHGPCSACERPSELPRPRAAAKGSRTAAADHERSGANELARAR
jgi:NADH:ubiquinone oxidoreductase subunit F (NADH-binding)